MPPFTLQDNSKTVLPSKQLKTTQNLGTKFQDVQRKWIDAVSPKSDQPESIGSDPESMTFITSGSETVRSLTTRFDGGASSPTADNKSLTALGEDEMRQTVVDQRREIENMRMQLVNKERRIFQLEEQVGVRT